jgi:DNA-binding CsgD family transcriptional regulator
VRRGAIEVMLRHGSSAADVAQLVMDVAEPGDVTSAPLLRRAAAQIGQVSPAVAVPLSRRALDLTPRGDPDRGAAVAQAIELLVEAGRAAEAAGLLTASASDLSDPATEARARLRGHADDPVRPLSDRRAMPGGPAAARRPPGLRVQLLSLMACGLDMNGTPEAAADPVADAIAEAAASGDPAAEIVTFVPKALLAFTQGHWHAAIDLVGEAVTRQHEAKGLRLWLPETWQALLLISELRLAEAHALIEAGTREAENIARNTRFWSMLRCRARLSAGQLADARAEAEAILDMSDEGGDENFGYLNHIARYALGDIALRTGDPVALQGVRRDAPGMFHNFGKYGTTKRLGAWLSVRLDGGPISPDLLDILAPGFVHAWSPLAHADVVELVRLLLAAGQRSDAVSVAGLLERAASADPAFPGLAPAAAHAGALIDHDPERAVAAAQDYRIDPRPLVRAAALTDAGRLLPEESRDEAVGYLDEALRLQSAAGAERDAARVRRLLRERGVQRAGGRPDPAAAQWPELTASELAVVHLVTQGATDREVAQRLYISAHTVNSHLRHVFAKLGIRSRVELARLAGERQAGLIPRGASDGSRRRRPGPRYTGCSSRIL